MGGSSIPPKSASKDDVDLKKERQKFKLGIEIQRLKDEKERIAPQKSKARVRLDTYNGALDLREKELDHRIKVRKDQLLQIDTSSSSLQVPGANGKSRSSSATSSASASASRNRTPKGRTPSRVPMSAYPYYPISYPPLLAVADPYSQPRKYSKRDGMYGGSRSAVDPRTAAAIAQMYDARMYPPATMSYEAQLARGYGFERSRSPSSKYRRRRHPRHHHHRD